MDGSTMLFNTPEKVPATPAKAEPTKNVKILTWVTEMPNREDMVGSETVARHAMPNRVRVTNSASPAKSTAAITSVESSAALMVMPPMVNISRSGGGEYD